MGTKKEHYCRSQEAVMSLAAEYSTRQSPFGAGLVLADDRLDIAEAVLAGAWRTLRAAGFGEAEVQALFDQIADRPEDLARRLRKMANAGG
jgi:glutathione S-transferase